MITKTPSPWNTTDYTDYLREQTSYLDERSKLVNFKKEKIDELYLPIKNKSIEEQIALISVSRLCSYNQLEEEISRIYLTLETVYQEFTHVSKRFKEKINEFKTDDELSNHIEVSNSIECLKATLEIKDKIFMMYAQTIEVCVENCMRLLEEE